MLRSSDPHVLLEWARDVGKTFPFLDFHVHPFDVLSGNTNYQLDNQVKGLYYSSPSVYHPAKVQPSIECTKTHPASSINLRSLLLASRLAYTNTGPKVLADQLDAAGLAGALLLPVARVRGAAENLLHVSTRMFQNNARLLPGCAFPIGTSLDKLDAFFRWARVRMGIRAIKLHPSLAGVDPLSEFGKASIEAMLAAAGSLDLPVVVHGGRTLAVEPVACREYGTLARIANVDWGISSAPVIIAHGGLYCLTEEETIAALDVLERLFERHPNLMADTSNLEPRVLQLVLERVDSNRLVFGSDALYVPIWKSWVMFLQTLNLVSGKPEDDLIRIASLNPMRCLNHHIA